MRHNLKFFLEISDIKSSGLIRREGDHPKPYQCEKACMCDGGVLVHMAQQEKAQLMLSHIHV